MTEPERYPPPDFDCPTNPVIKPPSFQDQTKQSSFHPSMWNWYETPACRMTEPGRYPPPDFDCPTNQFIRPPSFQYQPKQSNFNPSMWNWYETPSSPAPWSHNGHGGGPPGYHDWYRGQGGNGPKRLNHSQNFHRGGYQGGHRGGRQNHGAPHYQGMKKNKKEPEFSHFCDTCDRGFKNQEKYDEHMLQHVKCSVPDCNFTAHEKIVNFHWKTNHAPGAKRIKLETADEIAKWREERRRNFPTLQNVEKKRKIMETREARGDVLETAQYGRMRGRGRGQHIERFSGRGGFQSGPQGLTSSACGQVPPPSQPPREVDPLGALVNSDPESDRDEATGDRPQAGLVVAPKQMTSGLGALMSSYGSMSESESDGEPEAVPIQRARELVQDNQALLQSLPARAQDGGTLGATAQPQQRSGDLYTHQRAFNGRGRGRGRGRGGWGRRGGRGRHQHMGTPQKRRPSLLERLLAPDIRHERNVLLQCVRYIVRNNFFGLENRPKDQVSLRQALVDTESKCHRTQEMTSTQTTDSESTSVTGVSQELTHSQAVSLESAREEPLGIHPGSSGSEQHALDGPCSAVGANGNDITGDQHVENQNQEAAECSENRCDQGDSQSGPGSWEQVPPAAEQQNGISEQHALDGPCSAVGANGNDTTGDQHVENQNQEAAEYSENRCDPGDSQSGPGSWEQVPPALEPQNGVPSVSQGECTLPPANEDMESMKCPSRGLSISSDNGKPAAPILDDEIWEIPGGNMSD